MSATTIDLQRSPRTTSGCTSRGWAATPTRTCRSSSAATAATSRTRTGSGTSTRSRASSPSTSATRSARRSARRRSSRCASCPSTPTGRTRIPRAIELAGEVASLAPGDLNRVFFVSGGSEAVESAWKLARQYYAARGEKRLRGSSHEPERGHDAIVAASRGRAATRRSRATSPTTARRSAPSRSTASPRSGRRSSRSFPRCGTCATRTATTVRSRRPRRSSRALLLDDLEQTILAMGPETVCMVHMEPVQNAGGAFTPPAGYWQGVRALCDEYDILLSADEVITGVRPARLLVRLGALRHPARHRHVREGPLVVVRRDRRGDRDGSGDGAVPRVDVDLLARDHVRRPPDDVRDRAQEHRDHEARGHRRARARERRTSSARSSRRCSTCRSSATCAGRGSSTRSSWSRTRRRARRSTRTSARRCCAASSRGALFDAGLICRADDRGDPVVQISPPLVATERRSTRSSGSSATCSPRPAGACADACSRSRIPRRATRGIPPSGTATRRRHSASRSQSCSARDAIALSR